MLHSFVYAHFFHSVFMTINLSIFVVFYWTSGMSGEKQ